MTTMVLPWTPTTVRMVPERPADERELILAAQRGEEAAFGTLVLRHQRRAYAVARAIVLNHEDAEDAVQEGFLHAYRALERFRPDQAFGAWLHRIVANAALDITRRRRHTAILRRRRRSAVGWRRRSPSSPRGNAR